MPSLLTLMARVQGPNQATHLIASPAAAGVVRVRKGKSSVHLFRVWETL